MVKVRQPSGCALAAIVLAGLQPSLARAQDSAALPEITVTAERVEQPVNSTGSDVTVIPGSQVSQWGPQGITEVLREVEGVTVTQTGGPGANTAVRLRGAAPGQALVLIDGVPVGNVSSTDGTLDFGNLSAIDIDRIEVLRGPQSALYGSDAMSGVINIITKKGKKGAPVRTATVEAGSYGTITARASVSGATDAWTYSLGATGTHSDGFASYGYRVVRPLTIGDGVTPLPALPDWQPVNKGGVNGRFTYTLSETANVDFGFNAFGNGLQFANPYAFTPEAVFSNYNQTRAFVGDGFLRTNFAAFDGALKNHLGVFTSSTVNSVNETDGCFDAYFSPFNCNTTYHGSRWGVEYQGEFGLNRYGSLIFGARSMTEYASNAQSPDPNDGSFTPINAQQTTNSAYAEYRLPLLSRLDFTFGGRVDSIEDGQTFATGRATVAYHIDETGTKLRAAFGNGAKAPTLYQRYSQYGDPNLLPEKNVGGEIGIDQTLFGGRAMLSATVFDAYYQDLIAFSAVSSCTAAQLASGGGCYYNVGSARTTGVEFTAEATLLPGLLTAKGSYTYLDSRNLETNTQLLRVPQNAGSISLVWTPMEKVTIEPRLILVGSTLDYAYPANVTLPGYARIDVIGTYKVNDTFSAYVRLVNLTNANYEEVYNYGAPGRSAYVGVTAKF